jgi:hypothetical protein
MARGDVFFILLKSFPEGHFTKFMPRVIRSFSKKIWWFEKLASIFAAVK